jgi:DNA-binding XRE family transcriptional regulator
VYTTRRPADFIFAANSGQRLQATLATFKEEQIGARIKSLRIDRGLTLAEVADKTNFSRSYLSKLENSKTAPPVATLSAIADAWVCT